MTVTVSLHINTLNSKNEIQKEAFITLRKLHVSLQI